MNIYLLIFSWLIVAFGQPAYGDWLPLICSVLGFGPFFLAVADLPTKKRMVVAFFWYAAVQAVQLYWFTSLSAFGDPMMKIGGWAAYLFLIALWSLQFSLFSGLLTRARLESVPGGLAIAGVWSLFEISRLYVLSGFSWNPLGLALTGNPITAQTVSIGGIYLLSFWLVFQSALFYRAFASHRGIRMPRHVAFLLSVVVPWIIGLALLSSAPPTGAQTLQFAIYQTCSPPEAAFLAGNRNPVEATFSRWIEVIDELKGLKDRGDQIDLLVFPEYFVPFAMEKPIYPFEWVQEFLGDVWSATEDRPDFVSNQWLGQWIANYLQADVVMGMEITGERGQENGAALFVPNSHHTATYSKRILVPMGEEIPAGWLKPLAAKFGVTDSFIAGTEAKVLQGSKVAIGASICYEETFGNLMRENRQLGANLLVNLSNDIWYPDSLLAKQHFDHGRLRAIELGLPLLRACNGGISTAIASTGEELALTKEGDHLLLGRLELIGNPTIYRMSGNYLVILFSLFSILVYFFKK